MNMLFKNALLVLFLTAAVLGCDMSKFVNGGNTANTNAAKPSPSPTPKPSATPENKPQPESTVAKPGYIALLRKSAGKYPSDIKLLENAEIKPRLQKLLGKDWSDMKAKFDVETPNEIEDNIFKGEACEAHNCGDNRFIIYVDLDDGNINVFHIESGKTKKYLENGEIELPEKFAKDLAGG